MESLEGKKGMPRLKPPFPAMSASMAARRPSTMSKSIAVVPEILRRGAAGSPASAEEHTVRKSFASRAT